MAVTKTNAAGNKTFKVYKDFFKNQIQILKQEEEVLLFFSSSELLADFWPVTGKINLRIIYHLPEIKNMILKG